MLNKNESNPEKLSFLSVALLYVGTVMGAGFASGREIWQFFGVFGTWGQIGVLFAALLFVILGLMTAYISRTIGSNDMGRVVVPGGSPKVIAVVGHFMAWLLYTAVVSMSAAGGALLHQLFGLPSWIGGLLVVILVILTVLGEFQRVSRVFRYIMPVLFVTVVAVSLLVISVPLAPSDLHAEIEVSPMAPNWILASLLYISLNMLGMIAVVANSAVNARSRSHALAGAGLGGVFLGILALGLLIAVQTDMHYTQALDLPMLGFAGRLSPALTVVYGLILFFAIYSAATSNFYSFTTKIPAGPKKKYLMVAAAFCGFLLGLIGFKNVISFLFPMIGFMGFAVIGMLIVNFFCVWKGERNRNLFRGHERHAFPEPLHKVTGGFGGDVLLIFGPEKTVLYDAGMCCYAENTIRNVEQKLEGTGRTLDYVLLSHTHYDHVGGLPHVLERWPEAQVFASEKAKKVFESEGARNTILELGINAAKLYGKGSSSVTVENLRVDRILRDGDCVSLGTGTDGRECYIEALETKGHTDCCLSFVVEPENILLCSECCGVLTGPERIEVSALKSFDETIETARRLESFQFKHIYSQHYGMVPDWFCERFFAVYIQCAQQEKAFLEAGIRAGKSDEEILREHKEKYWFRGRDREQPFEAYQLNAVCELRQLRKNYFVESDEKQQIL